MAEYILLSIFFVFIILFVIYSRSKKLRDNFRHNMNDEEVAIEPPQPKPRRSLEDTLKALTQRHELPKIVEEENPAENLLQEVKDRRAKDLVERNKSLREIPDKKPIIPQLGNSIVESPETRRLKEQLSRGTRKNDTGSQNYYSMSSEEAHYDNYKTKQKSVNRFGDMLRNQESVRDVFVASEIFKTKF